MNNDMIGNDNKKHCKSMYLYISHTHNALIHRDNGDQINYAHQYAHREQRPPARYYTILI